VLLLEIIAISVALVQFSNRVVSIKKYKDTVVSLCPRTRYSVLAEQFEFYVIDCGIGGGSAGADTHSFKIEKIKWNV